MSTINAQNYGDGTDSVPASAVLEGPAKAWAHMNEAAAILGSYNIASATDNGTGNYSASVTNAFSASSSQGGAATMDSSATRIANINSLGNTTTFDLTVFDTGGSSDDRRTGFCLFGVLA